MSMPEDDRSIETQLLPCEPGWRVLFVDGHGEPRIEPLVCWARVEYQRHHYDDGWVLDYVQIEPRALVDRDVWNGTHVTNPGGAGGAMACQALMMVKLV
jgi:hypothetical protein